MLLKGIKGDAGIKGTLGRFGARGPVGQKVRYGPSNTPNVVAYENRSASLAGGVGRARNPWIEGKVRHKHK